MSIIISGPFVSEPTTTELLFANIPDDTNGIPPLIVAASIFPPRKLSKILIKNNKIST